MLGDKLDQEDLKRPLKRRQKTLIDLNLIDLICNILHFQEDMEIKYEAILLSNFIKKLNF